MGRCGCSAAARAAGNTPYRIVLHSPDRGVVYDGRTPELVGVGGGITARISLLAALAALGHDVTACVNCRERIQHEGVSYVPLDDPGARAIDADVFIAMSTGGALTFAPLRGVQVSARLKLVWVQGVPKPADLEAVGADRFVTASRFLRDVLVSRWGVPWERVWPCHNGLHQDRFATAEADWRSGRWGAPASRDPFALSYIGPPEKGLDAAVAVLARLRARDARYHLDVIGGGGLWGAPSDTRPPAAGVRMVGLVGQAALVPRLFDYEFCLAPQAMEEGFGIAVQEARRAGQIVIASRVGAFGELIEDGADGVLIDAPHTSAAAHDQFADRILDLAADPGRRERIRRRGVASASTFCWTAAARAWTDYVDLQIPRGRDGRVFLGGYYGHGNLGDDAILESLLAELGRQRPGATVTVASADPAATRVRHRVDAVDERDVAALAEAARRADAVVVGGGGLFHDHFGIDEATVLTADHWGLTALAAYPLLAAAAGRPFAIQDAGVGPLTSEAARRFTRLIFERASLASVRDAASRGLLQSIGADIGPVSVGADPAFLLDSAPADHAPALLADAGVAGGHARLVTMVLRPWGARAHDAAWQTAIAGALDRLAETHDAAVLFLTFHAGPAETSSNDRRTAEAVRDRMRHRAAAAIAATGFTPGEVLRILGASDLVVAMRLHGAILAASAGTPCVAIAYDPKLNALLQQLGMDDQIVPWASLTADALVDAAERAMNRGRRGPPDRLRAAARASVARLAALVKQPPADLPAMSADWRRLADRPAAPASLSSSARARRVYRRVALPPLKRLAAMARRHLMSAPAAVFDRYKRARIAVYGTDLAGLHAPGDPDLVSVVLPVYNGAAMVRESIDSVLRQTHARLELIVIDDGSTDDTAAIVDAYAAADARVRVAHQENQRLPAALSRGMRLARGEFLTWTSADNRMKPRCLEQLVACLRRHPAWDMTYGNLDVIGEDGRPLRHSPHYEGYQHPPGSEHVFLPDTPAELNVVANNSIGAAFLYRARVPFVLGDYSRRRFVMEDYDYWMQVNALMTLRHADIDEPLYDYRFHRGSLTSRWDEFDMLGQRGRMMVFDDARRDLFLRPMIWSIDGSARDLADALAARVRAAGHMRRDGDAAWEGLPRTGMPFACVHMTHAPAPDIVPAPGAPASALRVLVTDSAVLPASMHPAWDVCVAVSRDGLDRPPRLARDFQGWLVAADMATAFHVIDARAKSLDAERLEILAEPSASEAVAPIAGRAVAAGDAPRATVVICARRASDRLTRTLRAVATQRGAVPFEVILVDNSGRWALPADPPGVRVVVCPVPGLSAARNAGLAEARGDIVCFLDDDAVPQPEWLRWIVRAFDEHPGTAVVGGHIRLAVPDGPSPAQTRGWRKYWSDFQTPLTEYTEVSGWHRFPWGANWAARREALHAVGGFRSRYGRRDDDYWGGEEMVAASLIHRLGGRVAIEPRAVVLHDVAASRFTLGHVARTMAAGAQVYQRAQSDLYVPRPNRIRRLAARLTGAPADAASLGGRRWLDAAFRAWTWAGVVRTEMRDLGERARRPVVDED